METFCKLRPAVEMRAISRAICRGTGSFRVSSLLTQINDAFTRVAASQMDRIDGPRTRGHRSIWINLISPAHAPPNSRKERPEVNGCGIDRIRGLVSARPPNAALPVGQVQCRIFCLTDALRVAARGCQAPRTALQRGLECGLTGADGLREAALHRPSELRGLEFWHYITLNKEDQRVYAASPSRNAP